MGTMNFRRGWMMAALPVAALGLIFKPVVVSGRSMQPSFHDKQFVVMERAIGAGAAKRGDVVVFRHDGVTCIKRVLGVAGDTLDVARLANGAVSLDSDHILSMSGLRRLAALRPWAARIEHFRVPDGRLFVVGDNRVCSVDSREFGPIANSEVLGRVIPWSAVEGPVRRSLSRLQVAFAAPFQRADRMVAGIAVWRQAVNDLS